MPCLGCNQFPSIRWYRLQSGGMETESRPPATCATKRVRNGDTSGRLPCVCKGADDGANQNATFYQHNTTDEGLQKYGGVQFFCKRVGPQPWYQTSPQWILFGLRQGELYCCSIILCVKMLAASSNGYTCSRLCFKVNHSQRVNKTLLKTLIIAKEDGDVIAAHCNCMAGLVIYVG